MRIARARHRGGGRHDPGAGQPGRTARVARRAAQRLCRGPPFADLWASVPPRGLTRWPVATPARIRPDAGPARRRRSADATRLGRLASPCFAAPHRRFRHTGARHRASQGADRHGLWEPGQRNRDAAGLFAGFADVVVQEVDELSKLDWASLPQDGRYRVLVTSRRGRYGAAAAGWRPDLHPRALEPLPRARHRWARSAGVWLRAGALAVRAWLEGSAPANGKPPEGLQ